MKKLIILFFITLSLQGYSQENQIVEDAKIDKRVELLSVVFRLTGNSEYNTTRFKLYSDKIDQHFSPYKKHKLIVFAEKLINEKGLSVDAVMSMAINLDEKLNPRVDFDKSSLDKKWNKDDAIMFVKLLHQFYEETKCEDFFKDNEKLYHEAAIRFLHVHDFVDFDWYYLFYGEKPSEKFNIILALGLGDTIYSADYHNVINGEREVYSFMGVGSTDDSGMIEYDTYIDMYYTTLVHEFNHLFVNPLLKKHKELFRANGEKIFKLLEPEMRKQDFNNWETVLDEALVRASVIKYLIDHDYNKTAIEDLIKFEFVNSFFWIGDFVDELVKYDSQRNIYPTLESYTPILVESYNKFAEIVVWFDSQKSKVK